MIKLRKGVSESKLSVEDALREFDTHLRSHDYINGLLSLDRGFREVAMQKAAQRLFDQYNLKHSNGYRTLESYFLIAPKIKILGPKGPVQAGILGRRAHRRSLDINFLRSRDFYPKSIMGEGTAGGAQASLFFEITDWEIPELKDPEISELFQYSSVHRQKIDRVALDTYLRWQRGEKDAFRDELKNILGPEQARPAILENRIHHEPLLSTFETLVTELEYQAEDSIAFRLLLEKFGNYFYQTSDGYAQAQAVAALLASRYPDALADYYLTKLNDPKTAHLSIVGLGLPLFEDSLIILAALHPSHFHRVFDTFLKQSSHRFDEVKAEIIALNVSFSFCQTLLAREYKDFALVSDVQVENLNKILFQLVSQLLKTSI